MNTVGAPGILRGMALTTGAVPIQAPFPFARVYASSRARTEKAKKKNAKMSTKGGTANAENLEEANKLKQGADKAFQTSKSSIVYPMNVDETAVERADKAEGDVSLPVVDRSSILRACIGTSIGLSAVGHLARQVSHLAASSGLEVSDCTVLMPFRTELWHIAPVVGVVAVVTSSRQILLQIWQDFAVSTEVSNKQVLTSLELLDCVLVSCFAGVSEEFLFRGALLPFIGRDWTGILGAAVIFGVLHRSGGRNSAFAIWASYVGALYGILGVYTTDLATPMAAHAMSNFLSALIWKRKQAHGRDPM